jgi:hypothetical protein
MANVEWAEIPFAINSQFQGSFPFNNLRTGGTGPQIILDPTKCQAGSAKRVTRDNSPQRGGEIMHKHFKTGFVMQFGGIAVDVLDAAGGVMEPLCGAPLVDLLDQLMRTLDGIENLDGNVIWTPTGHPARAMYGARWLGPDGLGGAAFTAVLESRDSDVFVAIQFALVCPFPYAMNAADTTTALGGSTPVTIVQGGSTDFWPVVHVYGPTASFNIVCTNAQYGTRQLVYDSTLPGAAAIAGGQAIEFDFFRNTAYFGPAGGPYTGANAKPGIDVLNSDFWVLAPGNPSSNVVEIFGASADIIWQAAWI